MHKYDIYMCDLNPPKGHVQSGLRPCIVIQNSILNERGSISIVIPFTTKKIDVAYITDIIVQPSQTNGLDQASKIICNHMIALDKQYMLERVGVLDEVYLSQLDEKIKIILDLS